MLDVRRENTIGELAERLEMLSPVEPQREQFGVRTVTGLEPVTARIDEFIADADERIVDMTVDELPTDEHLDRLQAAEKRGVEIYIAGISDDVQDRIQETVPSAELFETLWEWRETPAGSLLITDQCTALANGQVGGTEIEETAIWGTGERNSLVAVLRSIFTWRLGNEHPE